MATSFDELVAKETTPEADGVVGVGLFAVNRSGDPYILKYAGRESTISDRCIDERSAWWLYSITKTLTAISALQCVQRGQIGLDDSVYDILPELKKFEILSIDKQGKMSFSTHTKPITLRHLLSHTSGIDMDAFDPRLQTWRLERGETTMAFCGDSIQAYTAPMLFEPGEGEHMERHIFEPLGMTTSTFHPDKDPEIANHIIGLSARISDGTLVPDMPLFPPVTKDDSGAMGLVSTVPDMIKLTTDLLQSSPKILNLEFVDQLFAPQFPRGSAPASQLSFAAAMFGRLIDEPYDDKKLGHGLGAFVIKEETKILPLGDWL